jgi:hypothetical protein
MLEKTKFKKGPLGTNSKINYLLDATLMLGPQGADTKKAWMSLYLAANASNVMSQFAL